MIPPKKRLCPICQKRRSPQVFPKGARSCSICKDTKRIAEKKVRKEESKRTWIKRLDKLVGDKVRARNSCESPRSHVCKGSYQWCHGISRSYHQTRWDIKNGFRMCQAEHYYFTNHYLEWEQFLESVWGVDGLREMNRKALNHSNPIDYKALYEDLNEQV